MHPFYFNIDSDIRGVSHLYKSLPYHNVKHVKEMLENLFLIFGDQLNDYELLQMFTSILYHDANYKAGCKDNELIASKLATKEFDCQRKPGDDEDKLMELKNNIVTLIKSTRIGYNFDAIETDNLRELAKILHDLDYMNFVNPFNEFYFRNMMIMEEFRAEGYPEEDIRAGMIQFMTDMIEKKGVFMTKRMSHMNAVAISNATKLIQEIKLLS